MPSNPLRGYTAIPHRTGRLRVSMAAVVLLSVLTMPGCGSGEFEAGQASSAPGSTSGSSSQTTSVPGTPGNRQDWEKVTSVRPVIAALGCTEETAPTDTSSVKGKYVTTEVQPEYPMKDQVGVNAFTVCGPTVLPSTGGVSIYEFESAAALSKFASQGGPYAKINDTFLVSSGVDGQVQAAADMFGWQVLGGTSGGEPSPVPSSTASPPGGETTGTDSLEECGRAIAYGASEGADVPAVDLPQCDDLSSTDQYYATQYAEGIGWPTPKPGSRSTVEDCTTLLRKLLNVMGGSRKSAECAGLRQVEFFEAVKHAAEADR